jgi:hypothetical protein
MHGPTGHETRGLPMDRPWGSPCRMVSSRPDHYSCNALCHFGGHLVLAGCLHGRMAGFGRQTRACRPAPWNKGWQILPDNTGNDAPPPGRFPAGPPDGPGSIFRREGGSLAALDGDTLRIPYSRIGHPASGQIPRDHREPHQPRGLHGTGFPGILVRLRGFSTPGSPRLHALDHQVGGWFRGGAARRYICILLCPGRDRPRNPLLQGTVAGKPRPVTVIPFFETPIQSP